MTPLKTPFKAALAALISTVAMITLQPAARAADEVTAGSIDMWEQVITANGTRAGAADAKAHILPPVGSNLPAEIRNRNNFYGFNPANAPATTRFPAAGSFDPAGLTNRGGTAGNHFGVVNMKQHHIYLNCNDDSCWGSGVAGNLTAVQTALSTSSLATVMNQYVGSTAANRYPLGTHVKATKSLGNDPWGRPVIVDSALQAIALARATATGQSGYGHIYHIFVKNGVDVCFDNSFTVCYSPTHSSTFAFCGYHGSFTSGNKHILYSVEPYDNVSGCKLNGMSANDTQVSVLSHEEFEAITDPDPNFQWYNDALGEIGDICAWTIFNTTLGGGLHRNIQLEYSNKSRLCAAVP